MSSTPLHAAAAAAAAAARPASGAYSPSLSYPSGGALTVSSTSGHDEQSAVLTLSNEGWVEVAFEDRMYGDDMECG